MENETQRERGDAGGVNHNILATDIKRCKNITK
jgi:hypothetical protein